MLLFKGKLLRKLSFDDESFTKLRRKSEKTVVEWFWRVPARVRLADFGRFSTLSKYILEQTKKTEKFFGNKKSKRDLLALSCSSLFQKSDFRDITSYKTKILYYIKLSKGIPPV